MKKIKMLLLGALMLATSGLLAQDYCMTAPIGYGAGVTGGGNATPTVVTNVAQLSAALTASGNGVVIISGDIQVDYLSVLVTNKTILGLPGSSLYTNVQTAGGSGILYFKKGSTNIIMRNVTFVGPGAYDSDGRDPLCFDGVTKAWVDHCDFQDGMDGNFDNKGLTDNITVSWCRFHYLKKPKPGGSGGTDDHRFTDLVGSSDGDFPTDKQYSITWQYCWWDEGCVERMVRARNAQLHMLNCYWNSSVANKYLGLGDGSGGKGTTCYVEGGVFVNTNSTKILDVSYGGSPDVKFVDCIGGASNTSTVPAAPTYSYTALPSGQVEAAVTNPTCGAGATLQVTTAGVVSANCNITNPTLVLTSTLATTAQSVSSGSAITPIVYSFGGTATTCTYSGLPTGVSAAINTTAKTVTITGAPTTAGSYTYTVNTTPTGASLTGTITVTANTPATLALTSATATAAQTINQGSSITNIVYTYGGGATSASVANLPAGVTTSLNTTAKTVTITGTPTAVATTTYTVSTVGGSSAATPLTGTIKVNAITPLAVPTGITATPAATSVALNWPTVANATGYTVNFCAGGTTVASDVVMYFNSTSKTLTSGDIHNSASTLSNTTPCSTGTITSNYRTGSANDHSLKLVNTTGVSKLKIGAKSSGSGVRALDSYSINGSAAVSTGITDSGVATCGEYTIDGLSLDAGDAIAFYFDGNVQISYYIATTGSATSSCTETNVATNSATITGLTPGISYTYQVKATSTNAAYTNSAYSASATVTTTSVDTNGTLVLTSGSNAQSVNVGSAITNIVYTYGGTANGATVTNLPVGVTYAVNTTAKTVTISGIPTAATAAKTYTVTTTQASGNAASLTGTINASAITMYPLTTSVVGSGAIALNPAGGSYAVGSVVTATATPSTGYTFTGWSGASTSAASSVDITMDGAKSLTATFTAIPAGAKKVAYVTDAAGATYVNDTKILPALKADANLIVTELDGKVANDYSAYDVIVLSEIPSSTAAGLVEVETSGKPIVMMKVHAYKPDASAWSWTTTTTAYGQDATTITNVVVSNTAHPIFKGVTFVNTNEVQMISAVAGAKGLTYMDPSLFNPISGGTASSIAYLKGATAAKSSILQIPAGTTINGTTLAKDLIQIGINGSSYGNVTADGIQIVKNAIYYLTGVTTDVDEVKTTTFTCVPNPVESTTEILLPSDEAAVIAVYGLSGRKVKAFDAQSSKVTLDMTDLNAGLYLITVTSNNQVMQQRIIKK